MKSAPIPVWLVTGYLGSGKTTLLKEWLRDPRLADAALIVNEIGEVGFDDKMLAQGLDSGGMLLPDQCVCCSGLPGLQEALSEMWWQRLRRERPRFGSVVIETTGIADPRPLARLFDLVPLLRERYVLKAIITTVSVGAGEALLAEQAEARAQVEAADVIVVTKADRDAGGAACLSAALKDRHAAAAVLQSANARLPWGDVLDSLAMPDSARPVTAPPPAVPAAWTQHRRIGPLGSDSSSHAMRSRFVPLPQPVSPDDWPRWLAPHMTDGLQRLKGIVQLVDDSFASVQWTLGDAGPSFEPYEGPAATPGLTTIGIATVDG